MTFKDRLLLTIRAIGADIKSLNTNKVTVVAGKVLSSNDYTTAEKNKLAAFQAAGYDNLFVNATSTGTQTLNLANATVFDLTLTGNTTIAFSNIPVPTNQIFSWVVKVTMGGTLRTLTLPTATWYTPGGVPPAAPAVGKMMELIYSTTNGTTLQARVGAYT